MNATMLSPSSLVDKVWHLTLLDNGFYNMLCQGLFPNATNMKDFIINHDPDGGKNPTERNRRYENTLRLMEKYFHEKPNPLVWEPSQSISSELVSSKRPRDDGDKTTDEELDEIITIRVRDLTAGDEFRYKVKKTTRMEKIMLAYAQRTGVALGRVRFCYDGHKIDPDRTPRTYDMENDDEIEVMLILEGC